MRVLVISSKYQPEYSGSGLRAHNTYKRLIFKYNIKVDIIANSLEFNNITTYSYDGFRITRIGRILLNIRYKNNSKTVYKFLYHIADLTNFFYQAYITYKYIKKLDYNIIHTFGNTYSISFAIIWCKVNNIPILREVVHQGSNHTINLPFLLKPFIGKLFNINTFNNIKVVAISKLILENCIQKGLKKSNIWLRPNPINENIYFPELNNKLNYRKNICPKAINKVLIICISKFIPSKNQIFLINVLNLLPRNYILYLKGPKITRGPLLERDKNYFNLILNRIKMLNLNDRVLIDTSFTTNPNYFIKMADVFVFPTKSDGLGTPMLESIACGVPVVANKIIGVTDQWIKDGRNGYLSSLDPKEFAFKIKKAVHIDKKTLYREANNVLKVASTKKIDQGYIGLLQKLSKRSNNEL